MFRYLIVIAVVIAIGIFGLGFYLQPNDLAKCGKLPNTNVAGCQPVDAIVAVSGGDTDARVNWAVNLYKNGWAKKLIFSGAALDNSGPSNAEAMKSIAVNLGVDEGDIIVDETSTSTNQNAQNVNLIVKDNKFDKIILVTSGYHQRRAFLEFSRYNPGITIKNSPALIDKDWSAVWWTSINGWWFAGSEFIKVIGFYVLGI